MNNYYKNLEVLVTGGAGFIGSHVCEELVNLGANVTALDNLSTGNLDNLSNIWDKIKFIKEDITNFESCLKASYNKRIIFHLAAFVSVPDSIQNPELCNSTNISGTLNLLESARINKVQNFIFSSSCAVYGPQATICTETTLCNPESTYGYSKYIGEILCQNYSKIYKLNTVILRYLNVYGARQNPHGPYAGVVAKFTEQLENNLPITIFGDGLQTRDFVPVQKIVYANLELGEYAHEISGQVFNIGTGKSITLIDLFAQLKKNYPDYTNNIIFEPARSGDIRHSMADCSKYYELTKQFTYKSNNLINHALNKAKNYDKLI